MSIAKDILRQLGVVSDDIESAAAGFRNDGVAQPNKFEVILSCPTGTRGSQRGNALDNVFSLLMGKVNSDGTARATGLRSYELGDAEGVVREGERINVGDQIVGIKSFRNKSRNINPTIENPPIIINA